MTRCRECHSIMTPTETTCLFCGSVADKPTGKDKLGDGFRTVITILFFLSAALTVASLFLSNYTPPFTRCAIATVVLLIVRTSAGEMVERKNSHK
ncbi:MAG TPA: hypothetical protein VKS01_02915 [Bryobacteraceae bacterium]|nr:hypothetical protein [Bryobacteraceae bacterium]